MVMGDCSADKKTNKKESMWRVIKEYEQSTSKLELFIADLKRDNLRLHSMVQEKDHLHLQLLSSYRELALRLHEATKVSKNSISLVAEEGEFSQEMLLSPHHKISEKTSPHLFASSQGVQDETNIRSDSCSKHKFYLEVGTNDGDSSQDMLQTPSSPFHESSLIASSPKYQVIKNKQNESQDSVEFVSESKPIEDVPKGVISNKRDRTEAPYYDVVRKKNDRATLPGHACDQCAKFYEAIAGDVSSQYLLDMVNKCSRHRYKHVPPSTPPHFWSVPSLNTPPGQQPSQESADSFFD